MDHLATHSSREANPGFIEGQLANISQPSSLQSSQSVDISNSSALDQASGTSGDIPGDEDAESITTVDEYYDARSEIRSISSLRPLEPSFYRMASASKASLVSVGSMLLAPSIGILNMNIRELAQGLRSKHRLSKTSVLEMTTYRSQSITKHMFVVLRLKQRRGECWLRLDRRMEEPANASLIFSNMQGPARDEVYRILFS